MGTVTVVTDSVACLPPEVRSGLGIEMVGAHLILDGREYRDGIDLTADEFYGGMGASVAHRTAAPSIGEWIAVMQAAVDRGARQLLVVTVTAALSGMYDGARAAAREMAVPAVVIDSRSAGAAEGMYVRRLAEEAQAGASLERLVEHAEARRAGYPFEFVIAGLRRLASSGRLPGAVARVGDAVDLKPMLTIGAAGQVRLTGAARSIERGMERICGRVLDCFAPAAPGRAVVAHALLAEQAERLAGRLRDQRPRLEVDVATFSPVMGASTGPIIGIAWEDPSVAAGAT